MNKYWFRKRKGLKTKDLGYGWIPISWEGWLVMVLMLLLFIVSSIVFLLSFSAADQTGFVPFLNGIIYLVFILSVIGLFAYISHKKTQSSK